MEFEWDEAKATANLAKHGVTFEAATRVFLDRNRLEWADDREDYGEARFCCIGMVSDIVLFVVYVLDDRCCRIISARRATRAERSRYASL